MKNGEDNKVAGILPCIALPRKRISLGKKLTLENLKKNCDSDYLSYLEEHKAKFNFQRKLKI